MGSNTVLTMGPLMVAVSDILKESVSQPIAQEGQLFVHSNSVVNIEFSRYDDGVSWFITRSSPRCSRSHCRRYVTQETSTQQKLGRRGRWKQTYESPLYARGFLSQHVVSITPFLTLFLT